MPAEWLMQWNHSGRSEAAEKGEYSKMLGMDEESL